MCSTVDVEHTPTLPSPVKGEGEDRALLAQRGAFRGGAATHEAALGESPLYLAASHAYRGDDRARIAALAALARALRHAARRHRRRALSRAPAPSAAGCAHLRARRHDHRRSGPAARGQRRAPPEAARARWRVCSAATRRRSRARSRSPTPAASRSTSSSTSIPTSRRRRARPRRRIWRTSPGRARAGASPTASPRRCARSSRASWS